MTFHEKDGLRYFTFASFDAAGVRHAVFTRRGGASRTPYGSLNVGSSVGDDPDLVAENRRRAFAGLGRRPQSAPELFQIHSNKVLVARLREPGEPLAEADGLVTRDPAFTLFMRFADCVPVLLYDPMRRVAGIAHAGWKGTVAKVAARAVEAMAREYGCVPGDILAGIGPSVGPDHYAVGREIVAAIASSFGANAEEFILRGENETRLNLWAANAAALREAGVRNIELAGICTACHAEDWYSHRAENGRTGRFGAMIWVD